MNNKLYQSLKFIYAEYERLKLKEKSKKITNEEKKTLLKLSKFLEIKK